MGGVDRDWSTRIDMDGRVLPPWVSEIVEAACDRFRVCADPRGAEDRSEDVADGVAAIARGRGARMGRIVGTSGGFVHVVAVVDGWVVDLCARVWEDGGVWPRVYREDRTDVWWPGDGWSLDRT
ncbi:hypothetical protein DVS28_b0307 (plasmid) [Euzebya pacifica]|uniref:Uncharacterized protein n=1 Tax=Euzebya pacifica TaxID=1608957 RepID=A0A346Y6I0_9ACTN|nr:hypothetical protein [Euzebya pacifica]AXV10077.1 hypothetical protein DVS28_b0307 [Euzebya pacifica]